MKHTESTVKFWFIENFLSPSFLVRSVLPPSDPETVIDSLTGLVLSSMQEFIPHLAMEYGFDYELVT
jgi:UDP-glucose:glycoprotein glucosyltransferase